MAPSRPPMSAHDGAVTTCPSVPRPARTKLATSSSTTVPTRKENVAACTLPTTLPSRELIGACMPTRQPAPTPSSTASPRLIALLHALSLGFQPVLADARVHRQRRLAIAPHGAHLGFDQRAARVGLRGRPFEEQLVMARQQQA